VDKDTIVVGIDVGSSKVTCLVGETDPDEGLRIIGVGVTPARGLRKGVVVDGDEAAECIAMAREKAERISGVRITRAVMSVGGDHIAAQNSHGVVAVARGDHEITQDDVDRVMDAARAIPLPNNRQLLHCIPRHFIIDGQSGILDPLGMVGFRLEVEAHIVTASTTAVQNLTRCLEKAGIVVDQMVLAPLAAAEAVLTPDERDIGVVLADIGGGTTSIAVFSEGAILHTAILRVGGNNLTNDLTIGLRLPFQNAEELKIKYGHAMAAGIPMDEMVDVPGFGARESQQVPRKRLCEIIEDRTTEIFALIMNEIRKVERNAMLPAGVVITGGTANLAGIAELGRETLQLPVRVGIPRGFTGLGDGISTPAYAVGIGLLQWGLTHISPAGQAPGPSPFNGVGGGLGRIVSWIRKAFLPSS